MLIRLSYTLLPQNWYLINVLCLWYFWQFYHLFLPRLTLSIQLYCILNCNAWPISFIVHFIFKIIKIHYFNTAGSSDRSWTIVPTYQHTAKLCQVYFCPPSAKYLSNIISTSKNANTGHRKVPWLIETFHNASVFHK